MTKSSSVLTNVVPLAAISGLASASGLGREVAMALLYGASQETDHVILILTPALLVASLMGTSAAGSIFIPLYKQSGTLGPELTARWTLIATLIAVAATSLAAGLIALSFGGGSANDAPWLIVTVLASGGVVGASWIAGWASAIAHMNGRFLVPAWGEVAYGLIGLVLILVGSVRGWHPSVYAVALFAGASINTLLSLRAARVSMVRILVLGRPARQLDGLTRRSLRLWGIGSAGHLNLIGERILAASLAPGAVSALHYGRKVAATIASVLGGSVAVRSFPGFLDQSNDSRRSLTLRAAATGGMLATIFAAASVVIVNYAPLPSSMEGAEIVRRGVILFLLTAPILAVYVVVSKLAQGWTSLRVAVVGSLMLGACTLLGMASLAIVGATIGRIVAVTGVSLAAAATYLTLKLSRGARS